MRLEAVGKRYGARHPWVVRGLSAEVPAGRLIRVDGRNGSGKSTLLRVVAGVSRPSAGRVTGRPHCGYVPERVAAGGRVLFVDHDHDPARLAGREDERWHFDGSGGVTVLAGPASGPGPTAAPRVDRVTIRLETADASAAAG